MRQDSFSRMAFLSASCGAEMSRLKDAQSKTPSSRQIETMDYEHDHVRLIQKSRRLTTHSSISKRMYEAAIQTLRADLRALTPPTRYTDVCNALLIAWYTLFDVWECCAVLVVCGGRN